MTDESKLTKTAEAIKTISEAIPIYQDAIQPAAKEIGEALQTVAQLINDVALAPLRGMIWGWEKIGEFVVCRLSEKLKDVPKDKIITPDPHVAGPALEALKFVGNQPELREMYANLLATAMNQDKAESAHPSFVEIVNQITPDEARIINMFAKKHRLPMISIYKQKGNVLADVLPHFTRVGIEAKCELPHLDDCYINNLCRLGLLELSWDSNSDCWSESISYEELLNDPEIKNVIEEIKKNLRGEVEKKTVYHDVITRKEFIRLTSLGELFCKACVP
jgi:hypothetical protein